MNLKNKPLNERFRGYLPVIIDIETAGFKPKKNPLLEIATVIVEYNADGCLCPKESYSVQIMPFKGAELEQSSLDFNGIKPYHPFRMAVDEKTALTKIFTPIKKAVKKHECTRAILVGHNPAFDISFLNAAIQRTKIKSSPFHQFSTFDTATLAGLVYGQTVLAKATKKAGMSWNQNQAHCALYDAEQTAKLFCKIVNRWQHLLHVEQQTLQEQIKFGQL